MENVSDKAKQVAKDIESIVNQMGNTDDTNYIVNHLVYMHRTLNQSFVSKIIFPFLREMNIKFESKNFDERNEVACRVCSRMWKRMCDDHCLEYKSNPTLPSI